MHNEGNSRQGGKAVFRTGENNRKWNDLQRVNLQNTQAAHAAQYQKNKQPNQKVGKRNKHVSPKNTYKRLINTWQDAQHHSLLEKCKSKLQWDTTSYQSEWLSSKCLQTINAGENMEKMESSCTAGGNVNWYSHYGRWYGDSFKNLE